MVGQPGAIAMFESRVPCAGPTVVLWNMGTVVTRQKYSEALSTQSLALLPWMRPTRCKMGEEWVMFFRRWQATTRKTFNSFGYSLLGPAQTQMADLRWIFGPDVKRVDRQEYKSCGRTVLEPRNTPLGPTLLRIGTNGKPR